MAKQQARSTRTRKTTTDTDTTPGQAPTNRPRNPFLTVNDVNRQGQTKVKCTGVVRLYRFDDGRVNVILEVVIGTANGPHRDYSVQVGRRSFIAATRVLGQDLGQWGGQLLTLEVDATGKYVNVYDPEAPPAKGTTPAPASTGTTTNDDIPF